MLKLEWDRYESASLCGVDAVNNFSGEKYPSEFLFPKIAYQKFCEKKGWSCPFGIVETPKNKVENGDVKTFSLAEAAYLLADECPEEHWVTDAESGEVYVIPPENGFARQIYNYLYGSIKRDMVNQTISLDNNIEINLPPLDNPFNYFDGENVAFERRYYFLWWLGYRGQKGELPKWLQSEVESKNEAQEKSGDEIIDGMSVDFVRSLIDKNSSQYRPRLLAALLLANELPEARALAVNPSNPQSVRKKEEQIIKRVLNELRILRNGEVTGQDIKAILRILNPEKSLRDGRPSQS